MVTTDSSKASDLTDATNPADESLRGLVERITFHNENNGFCVLRVKVPGKRDLMTVVGVAATIHVGEHIQAFGQWLHDKQYGQQFRAHQLTVILPNSSEDIEKYLASGLIKGIGPHFAKTLVDKFGAKVFEVIENAPQTLLHLPGLGAKKLALITKSWADQKSVREIMLFLQHHGVTTSRAVRIYKTYGQAAIAKITANPYQLALDIFGIGFKTADELALRLNIPKDSVIRAQAGVRHVLQDRASNGHCAMPEDKLIETTMALLEVEIQIAQQGLQAEVIANRVVSELDEQRQENLVWLQSLYRAENQVARHVHRLQRNLLPWGHIDSQEAIPWVEKKTGLQLSTSQQEAIIQALKSKVMILTGGPGVGKTTIIRSFLQIISHKVQHIMLAAPTGRAAKRLSETTGREAKTIHRLLAFDPANGQFQFDAEKPLNADLVVIDECSMVDVVLMSQLLRAIPSHAAVLLVGDVDQLPSVGPGNVLRDLIASNAIPVMRLSEIFRQAATSQIIQNAHRVNQGKIPHAFEASEALTDFYYLVTEEPEQTLQKLQLLVTERIPKRFNYHPITDIQVLAPMQRGMLGVRNLNFLLQQALNGQAQQKVTQFGQTFAVGDKVVQTVNNYDKDVFNGDVGCIEQISHEDKNLQVKYDDRLVQYEFSELDELLLAYAMTIHKSQGSEYPVVIIPLCTSHYMLLERNLLYTGITRGKRLVVLIGPKKAVAMAVHRVQQQHRITRLDKRLQGEQRVSSR